MDLKELTQRFPTLGPRLESDDLAVMEKHLPTRIVTPGEVLVAEGDHATSCWLLWDGMLAVSLRLRGRTISLGRFGPGSIVGEVAFSDGGPATATVSAATPCTLFELKHDVMDRLCATSPRLATALLESACVTMATHLRSSTDRLESLRSDGTFVPELGGEKSSTFMDALRGLFGISS